MWASADPILGRYLSLTDRGNAGGVFNAKNLALFTYSYNTPVVLKDPDGRCPWCVVVETTVIQTGGAATGAAGGYHPHPASADVPRTTPPLISHEIDNKVGGFAAGAWNGLKTLVTNPGKAWENFKENTGLGNIMTSESSPTEILLPGGKPIGEPGATPGIRELGGGTEGAEKLFGQLTKGGEVIEKPGYPGTLVKLPNGGGTVGIRPESRSGDTAIDVNIPGLKGQVDKIHFPPSRAEE